MSDTTVEVEPVKAKKLPPPPYRVGSHPCGHCATNHHTKCVGATQNWPEGVFQVYRCPCTCAYNLPRCFTCNFRYTEEQAASALTTGWTCTDVESCEVRQRRAREASPLYALITQIKEQNNMATTTRKAAAKKAATKPAKPTSGKCRCCDGATKGGNFLPGHDARYVSQFVEAVQAGHTTAAKVKAELKPISEALVGKFDKGLAQAKARAEKAKATAK